MLKKRDKIKMGKKCKKREKKTHRRNTYFTYEEKNILQLNEKFVNLVIIIQITVIEKYKTLKL